MISFQNTYRKRAYVQLFSCLVMVAIIALIPSKAICKNSLSIFVVQMKDGQKIVEGILKMRFSKKLSGFSEHGFIEFEFDKVKSIFPTDDRKVVVVNLITGETIKMKLQNSLYIENAVFGQIDVTMDNVKKIVRKEFWDNATSTTSRKK